MSAQAKKHAQREKQAGSAGDKSSSSGAATGDSPARAISGFDGNRDHSDQGNLSGGVQVNVRRLADGIGFGGWSATRGVSLRSLLLLWWIFEPCMIVLPPPCINCFSCFDDRSWSIFQTLHLSPPASSHRSCTLSDYCPARCQPSPAPDTSHWTVLSG